MDDDVTAKQLSACTRAGVSPMFLSATDRIAIGRDFDPKRPPINGLRHPEHGNLCGWYIWNGEELSNDPDYFEVVCYDHLADQNWSWVQYLALPIGWRFLAASEYEDMWFDETLFNV